LKNFFGLEVLIDPTGIEKDKNLTNLAENCMKSINDNFEEKYFSKISTFIEKLYILMGDFRISKTQASDIFWKLLGFFTCKRLVFRDAIW